jgi:pyruvate/2-oxoglutarate dehydrogenase complex dihydrolipoamide acyltransferase (E2) component
VGELLDQGGDIAPAADASFALCLPATWGAATLVRWLVAEGDEYRGQGLAELETDDKGTVRLEPVLLARIVELMARPGDRLVPGAVLLRLAPL